MKPTFKRIIHFSILLIIISACSLLDGLNPLDNAVSELEELADQIPIDEIEKEIQDLTTDLPPEIETLATDLPGEIGNIEDGLGGLATDLPSEIDDILGSLDGIVGDESRSDQIPADIPIVDGPTEDFFGSENLVSYLTQLDFNTVLAFYQEQMILNGWTTRDGSMITKDVALLYYKKTDREATITLSSSHVDDKTAVMIIVQQK